MWSRRRMKEGQVPCRASPGWAREISFLGSNKKKGRKGEHWARGKKRKSEKRQEKKFKVSRKETRGFECSGWRAEELSMLKAK